jgi:dolichol kinase
MFILNYSQEILSYLLLGVVVSFLLESVLRKVGEDVNMKERIGLIFLWPIMLLLFVYNFLKEVFKQ